MIVKKLLALVLFHSYAGFRFRRLVIPAHIFALRRPVLYGAAFERLRIPRNTSNSSTTTTDRETRLPVVLSNAWHAAC